MASVDAKPWPWPNTQASIYKWFVIYGSQVKPRFKLGIEEVVDTALGEDYDKDVLKLMTEVALACTAVSKNDRPTMKVRVHLFLL